MKSLFELRGRWFHYFRPEKQLEVPKVTIAEIEKLGELKLADIFASEKKYQFILDAMAERGFISPVNHCWMDFHKGYKKTIVALLKKLQVQGYYKCNEKLSHHQIMDISYNTFGVIVRIDTVKHTAYDDIILDFIPPADNLFTS